MNQTDIIVNYQNELKRIEDTFLQFYDKVFPTEQDEYRENKSNKAALGQLMLTIWEDNRLPHERTENLLNSCLGLLTNHTGCQEDEEIASDLIKNLGFLKDDQLWSFFQDQSTNRWR